jgi:CheY-like chemotaxis protein
VPGRLVQVFLNLLLNASQAIDEGDAAHHVIRVRTWAEGGEVCASVSDTGTGIAPEHLRRLFEPFFTTKPMGVGTGLGLAICRSIVEGHKGRIEVESEPGRGSCFTVRLPRYVEPPVAARPRAGSPTTPPCRRGRILVVDDEQAILDTLERLLRRDHDVVTRGSGAAALELLETDRAFDAILSDLMMAEVSGVDLYEWVASRDEGLASRMVFMTGGVFTQRAIEFCDRVKSPLVYKPFDTKLLRLLIREVVGASPR